MNTEVAIRNGQSRKTGNIGYTRRKQTKQIHNTICVGHNNAQTNTNNVNKTADLLEAIGGKDEPNIDYMWKSSRTSQHETQNVKTHNRTTQKTKKNEQHGHNQITGGELRCSGRVGISCFL